MLCVTFSDWKETDKLRRQLTEPLTGQFEKARQKRDYLQSTIVDKTLKKIPFPLPLAVVGKQFDHISTASHLHLNVIFWGTQKVSWKSTVSKSTNLDRGGGRRSNCCGIHKGEIVNK